MRVATEYLIVLQKLINASPLLRKATVMTRRVPRAFSRMLAKPEDYEKKPPILANSFPKSGTHLLLQVLAGVPGVRFFGAFLASTPSIPFRERSVASHRRLIARIAPGELIPGHLYYKDQYQHLLDQIHCVHYFIYRDPRDVVVSEAYYLTYMNRWHRLHPYFKRLKNEEDRISFSILGARDQSFPYDYPDIGRRFEKYRGWLSQDGVLPVRFEDLVSERRSETIGKMLDFYEARTGLILDREVTLRTCIENINPHRSHTFRQGAVGTWRKVFTDRHRQEMKEVASQLLIDLKYETGLKW